MVYLRNYESKFIEIHTNKITLNNLVVFEKVIYQLTGNQLKNQAKD